MREKNQRRLVFKLVSIILTVVLMLGTFPDVGIRKESDRKRIVILIDGQVVVFGQGFKPVEGAPPAVGAQNIPDAEHIVHQIRNAVVPVLVGAGLHADLIAEIRHGLLHG